jgi:hypothetical protein
MKIVSLLINEDVARAERKFDQATADNIVDLCREYLVVLFEYRSHLTNLPQIPEVNFAEQSSLGRTLAEQSRMAVTAAIGVTETAEDLVEALLRSFTEVSASDAVETFNRLGHNGSSDWNLDGSLVRAGIPSDGSMTDSDAIETAKRLRREAYVEQRITFLKSSDTDTAGAPA